MNTCKCGAPIPDDHDACTVCEAAGSHEMHRIFDQYSHVVGIDPSFTATGIVVLDRFGVTRQTCIKTDSSLCTEHRMCNILTCIYAELMAAKVEYSSLLACIEMNHVTPGRSAQTALLHRELIGFLSGTLWKMGPPVERVSPKEAKKALAGSGNADKDDDMVPAAADYPGFEVHKAKYVNQACADALGTALAGMENHGA